MHVRFRAAGSVSTESTAIQHSREDQHADHAGTKKHDGNKKQVEQQAKSDSDFMRAFAAPPPFAPQQLNLRCVDSNERQACYCRQTMHTVTLVLLVTNATDPSVSIAEDSRLCVAFRSADGVRRLEVKLFGQVHGTVHCSLSAANIVLVLEKLESRFWPTLSPVITQTSTTLKF